MQHDIDYGRYARYVGQVLEIARSPLLRGGKVPKDLRARLVDDLTEARRYAWEQPHREIENDWTDLREKQAARVRNYISRIPGMQDNASHLHGEFEKLIPFIRVRSLPREYASHLDDVFGDLYLCALSRLAQGPVDAFFEALLAVYRSGGWPCGWAGSPPDGKPIAFWPR